MTVNQNQIDCEDLKTPLKKRILQVSKLDNDITKEEVNNLQETKDTNVCHENVEAEEKLSADACKDSNVIIDQDKLSNLNNHSESCLSRDIKEFAKLLENVETEEIDKIILQNSSNEIENFPDSPTKIFEEIDELKAEICRTEDVSKTQQIFNTYKTPKKEITTPFSIKNEENQFLLDTFNVPVDNITQKYNSISDHKYIKDTVKSELYDPVDSDDLEAMNLLSDFNTAMDFENLCDMDKASSEVLLPTITCDDVAQGEDDNTTEFIEDPSQDPLFIDTDEKLNTTTTSITLRPRSESKKTKHFQIKTSSKYENRKRKDESYIEITEILKELKNMEIKDKSENAANRLSNLKIKLTHDVPPQHKVKYNIGRKEKVAKGKSLAEYGPIRRGKFSASEDEIIMNNWKMFCKVHNWNFEDMKPFLYPNNKGKYCMNSQKKYRFMQFLANGLPWRLLDSVHQRFVKLGKEHINNTLRAEQNKKLITYMEKTVHNEERLSYYCDILEKRGYEELAKVLKKKNLSVHKKYSSPQNGDFTKPLVKVTWTLSRIAKFIKILLKATLSENIKELKNAVIPYIIWMKIQKKLNIHHDVLRRFWVFHLHMQLFYPYPIYQNDIKIQLIEYMYGKGISDKKEIEWNNVAKHFDGITSTCLARTFRQLTRCAISSGVGDSFTDIVEYLYTIKIPALKKCSGDYYLPRIKYKNGKVIVINYEEGDNIEDNSTSDDDISITSDSMAKAERNNGE